MELEPISEYEKLREESRELYASTDPIFSPALNDYVHFTAEGFNHLLFKGSRVEREVEVQEIRLGLFPLAVKLIGLSTTYQEYEERQKSILIKKYKEKIYGHKKVIYWGIIAIIESRKIKVVLRMIEGSGPLHFWSVIPDWTTSKSRDEKLFANQHVSKKEEQQKTPP